MTDLDKHLQEIASEIWLECMNFKNDPGYPRTSAEFNAWLHDKIKEINSIPKEINVDLSEILDELINQVEWSVRVPGAVEIDRVKESKAKTEAIAAIHSAFKDAGYDKHDWSITPGSVRIDGEPHMTGAEWYERFTKELVASEEQARDFSLDIEDMTSLAEHLRYDYAEGVWSEMLKAARRASGINNDKVKQ